MKLSLSVRVAENFRNKRVVDIALPELARIAKVAGFDALCMRASMVGIDSPSEQVSATRELLDELGLAVSMVTGDFAVPENGEEGPGCLRHITPYLDLAAALGSDLIRICMKHESDIPCAQRAADEARERHIRLAHQSHNSSPFETVEGSLRVLKAVGRENFGIIYEPANWYVAGEEYGKKGIEAVQDYIFNVYVQNHRLDPEGPVSLETWCLGERRFHHIPLWEPGGVGFDEVAGGLRQIGYEGFVTVHQAYAELMEPREAAIESFRYLHAIIS